MSFTTIIQLLVIPTLLMTTAILAQSHNDVCGPNNYCNGTAGLICGQVGRCVCSNGELYSSPTQNINYSYKLTWDGNRNLCVGEPDSACVGTRRNPSPHGMKKVDCSWYLSCAQIPGLPLGLGLCKNVPQVNFHGNSCSQSNYCDADRGLVCSSEANYTCSCAAARGNTSPKYDLVWDNDQELCVGSLMSGCIGTDKYPVPDGQKAVGCVLEGECRQENELTPAVGICRLKTGSGAAAISVATVTSGILSLSVLALSINFM